MFWRDAHGNFVPPVSETEIRVPSEMLAICDSLMKSTLMAGGDDFGVCSRLFGGDMTTAPYVLGHGKNYNQLLCDGHVSAEHPSLLFNPSNSAAMWDYDHQAHPELWIP